MNRPFHEGNKPFAPESHKIHVLNNFPVPLMFSAARVVGVAPKAAKGEPPPDSLMSSVSAGSSDHTHSFTFTLSFIGDCLILEHPVHDEGQTVYSLVHSIDRSDLGLRTVVRGGVIRSDDW